MEILGVSGSPRKGGNTETLLRETLQMAERMGCTTRTFPLSEKAVAPCKACGGCFQSGACVIQDDMQELYALSSRADAIVWASPVYFGDVTAQLKCVMDRTFAQLQRRSLKNKVAGVLVVTRRVGAVQAKSLVNSFCIVHGMVVAGGAIGYGRDPGDVLTGVGGGMNMTAMEEARLLGEAVVNLAKRLRGAP
ncbi:MAG: flavodoxin family protein [Acidobacteriota bacterium]|jgi:multimeric flavodoxin WrbA|nr:flavodoxin family protein [Acidobacteriota bacterium]